MKVGGRLAAPRCVRLARPREHRDDTRYLNVGRMQLHELNDRPKLTLVKKG